VSNLQDYNVQLKYIIQKVSRFVMTVLCDWCVHGFIVYGVMYEKSKGRGWGRV